MHHTQQRSQLYVRGIISQLHLTPPSASNLPRPPRRTLIATSPHRSWEVSPNIDTTSYWDQGYLRTRPTYPASFYHQIYDYHTAASPSSTAPTFTLAHDIGAGPGHVAHALAHKFPHVHVSDIDPRHLTYAQHLHHTNSPSTTTTKFTYTLARAEHLAAHFPPASADLILSALLFPLLPSPATALRACHTVLKPAGGGTLAIAFYGLPHFSEAPYAATCQPLLDGIVDRLYQSAIRRATETQRASYKREADAAASWLDCLAFPAAEWRAVQRWTWNRGWARMGFFTGRAGGFVVEPVSRVRAGEEEVVEVEDRGLWRREWDVCRLRRFVSGLLPLEGVAGVEGGVVSRGDWGALAAEMGGMGVKRAFSWPVVLVLAKRR
ncbi:S-adenosyl-L-methionine-dependent methyltransferase [Aspergillus indologenus CBS 114.80]|uniref:S-adenosyl-L-methionine-dependent methyltransferase n=1 Tax=Aspergillus indologenus CBS 114.80 TaxID=1450541 RepID=A0A2V5IX80_9EURO|nr:S-adenosyl-L-methionine-dependent methyltransferase [Aspergillus indologenus CBS 114.80]